MRRQPGEHLVLGPHRLAMRPTPPHISQEQHVDRHGGLRGKLQPTGREGLPAGRRVRWGRQHDARLGLGPRPQGPRQLLPRGPTVTAAGLESAEILGGSNWQVRWTCETKVPIVY